jgi:8-oxo-dGTP diphosphatase
LSVKDILRFINFIEILLSFLKTRNKTLRITMQRYSHTTRLLVATDCIIFGFDGEALKVLLIKRKFEPEKGKWSLLGGFVDIDEDLEDGAKRILYHLTGLNNIYIEQLKTYGEVNRDPVERTISVAFSALINIHDHDEEAVKAHNAVWFNLYEKPNLIFDHDKMLDLALEQLRYKAALHPIGFELMAEKFSIPQLHKLYEAIYNMKIDRRNFSRKILSTKLLIDTGEKNEQSATKKAILYRLDKVRYADKFHSFWHFMPDAGG